MNLNIEIDLRKQRPWCYLAVLLLIAGWTQVCVADNKSLETLEEQAVREAVALVDPSIVRIETVGGLGQSEEILFGTGPTSGVIVSADGYVISSSFNFAAKPASILVTLPDGRRFPARQIAHDRQRMLTLLKIDVDKLTPAQSIPRNHIQVGAWAIAVGRTYDLATPNISLGIVSAVNRIWGKAIQTDAKISPVNYGGPLIDIEGRVMGICVPMSPDASGETAGVEWYDGGIGFAVPLEDIEAVLDRLKQGQDLLPGLMGVTFKPVPLGSPQEMLIDRVRYDSPAYKSGLKVGDRLMELEGKPVARVAHLRYVLGRKYAGDELPGAVERNQARIEFRMQLAAELKPYECGYLGIVPQRQMLDPQVVGVPIRAVLPDSPAAKAGLEAGDRILVANDVTLRDSRQLADAISRLRPAEKLRLVWQHAGAERTANLTLGSYPENVPAVFPSEVMPVPEEQIQGPPTGRLVEKLAANDREFWLYVPEKYTAKANYGLVVWIHPGGDTMEAEILKTWKTLCDRRGLILLGPKAETIGGWTQNESESVRECVKWVQEKYQIDSQRIVLHSYGNSGPFATLLTFKHRDLYRGVALASLPLVGFVPENEAERRLQFYFVCGAQDPLYEAVQEGVEAIRKAKFPVTFTTLKETAHQYPSELDVEEIARWIDLLDRI